MGRKVAFVAITAEHLEFIEKLLKRLDHSERIAMRLRQKLRHRRDGSPWIPGLESKLAWAVLDHYSVDFDFPADHIDMWKAAPAITCKWMSPRVLVKVLGWFGITLTIHARFTSRMDDVQAYRSRSFWDEVEEEYSEHYDHEY